jgi:phytol kinase
MIPIILTVLVVLAVLVANEWWWRGRSHGEISRKFVHITVGSFVAFWPLFLSWREIETLSLAFIVVVIISQKLQIFKAIHSVQRPTSGEIYFGLAVGAIALITHNPAIYTIALAHMALADGMAAIIGVKYGASRAYILFGARKSVIGSLTFLLVSVVLMAAYGVHTHTGFSWWLPAGVIGATLLENIAVRGLDNLAVPIYIAVVLKMLV